MGLMSMFPGGGTVGGSQPLKAPTNLKAQMGTPSEIHLTWTDPENEYSQPSGVLIGEWMFTRIVRKIGSPPVNANDGELVVESAVKNQYEESPFVDKNNISIGTEYYYAAFAFTKTRVSSNAAIFRIMAEYYDPILNNNTWTAIVSALKEGVASDLWRIGDEKTDPKSNITFVLEKFDPPYYPISNEEKIKPKALFVVKNIYALSEYTDIRMNINNTKAEFSYSTSRLKALIDGVYTALSDELKSNMETVDISLWAATDQDPASVTTLEKFSLNLFPLSEAAVSSLYPTPASRIRTYGGRKYPWHIGDIAPAYGDRTTYSGCSIVDDEGTIKPHTDKYGWRQDYGSTGAVFGFCIGR